MEIQPSSKKGAKPKYVLFKGLSKKSADTQLALAGLRVLFHILDHFITQ